MRIDGSRERRSKENKKHTLNQMSITTQSYVTLLDR